MKSVTLSAKWLGVVFAALFLAACSSNETKEAEAAAAAAASASLVSLLEHAARNSAAKTTPNHFALSVTLFIMFALPQSLEPKTCLM